MLASISTAAQDYLKGLYTLVEAPGHVGPVSTTAIAQRLGVSAASATNMLKRLAAAGLLSHVPYKGVALTDAGRKIALEVIRHHRLLETYLADALGVPWDRVHDEAEVLEHVLSEELEERISARLGHPTADPHGHPIPSKELLPPALTDQRLWDTHEGERVTIERVSDSDPEALRYLAALGIRPGAQADVGRRGPVGGPLFIRVVRGGAPGDEEALSRELAEAVWVA